MVWKSKIPLLIITFAFEVIYKDTVLICDNHEIYTPNGQQSQRNTTVIITHLTQTVVTVSVFNGIATCYPIIFSKTLYQEDTTSTVFYWTCQEKLYFMRTAKNIYRKCEKTLEFATSSRLFTGHGRGRYTSKTEYKIVITHNQHQKICYDM